MKEQCPISRRGVLAMPPFLLTSMSNFVTFCCGSKSVPMNCFLGVLVVFDTVVVIASNLARHSSP